MATTPISKQALIDAQTDADSIAQFANGGEDEFVNPRIGEPYPTAQNVVKNVASNVLDALVITTNVFANTATGLSNTVNGQFFSVLSASALEYVILYLNSGGVAVEQRRYPSYEYIRQILRMIQPNNNPDVYWNLNDISGAMLAYMTATTYKLPMVRFEQTSDGSFVIKDAAGGVAFYNGDDKTSVGPLSFYYVSPPGVYLVNEKFEVIPFDQDGAEIPDETPTALEDGIQFAPILATAESYDTEIHVKNLIPRRYQADDIVANIGSPTTEAYDSGPILKVSAARFGTTAVLNLRERNETDKRTVVQMQLKNVPVQTGTAVKVLVIGDSIGNRQGAYYIKQFLESMGFAPTFIGTMHGSASSSNSLDIGGPLGECREGWETGDYTNAVTNRALIIDDNPGAVDEYLNRPKSEQRDYNPFARVSTGSDSPDIVRNGRVFDAAFYQTRFGLETPDVVVNALGTNDVRDLLPETIYDAIYDNDRIMHSQIRAAWPDCKILRMIPGTAYDESRNTRWEQRYVPGIKAMRDCIAARADAKVILVPTWAYTNPETGYVINGTAGPDGTYIANWGDDIHPIGTSRILLYKALAPFVGAAKLNLI